MTDNFALINTCIGNKGRSQNRKKIFLIKKESSETPVTPETPYYKTYGYTNIKDIFLLIDSLIRLLKKNKTKILVLVDPVSLDQVARRISQIEGEKPLSQNRRKKLETFHRLVKEKKASIILTGPKPPGDVGEHDPKKAFNCFNNGKAGIWVYWNSQVLEASQIYKTKITEPGDKRIKPALGFHGKNFEILNHEGEADVAIFRLNRIPACPEHLSNEIERHKQKNSKLPRAVKLVFFHGGAVNTDDYYPGALKAILKQCQKIYPSIEFFGVTEDASPFESNSFLMKNPRLISHPQDYFQKRYDQVYNDQGGCCTRKDCHTCLSTGAAFIRNLAKRYHLQITKPQENNLCAGLQQLR